MKCRNFVFLNLFLSLIGLTYSQDITQDKDLLPFHLCNSTSFYLKTTIKSDGSLEFLIYEDLETNPNKQEFKVYTFTQQIFKNGLIEAISKMNPKPVCLQVSGNDAERRDNNINSLFYAISYAISVSRSDSTRPIAGVLSLKKEAKIVKLPPSYSFSGFYRQGYKWYYSNYLISYIDRIAAYYDTAFSNLKDRDPIFQNDKITSQSSGKDMMVTYEGEDKPVNVSRFQYFSAKARDSLYHFFRKRFGSFPQFHPEIFYDIAYAGSPRELKKAFKDYKSNLKLRSSLKSIIWEFITTDIRLEWEEQKELLIKEIAKDCIKHSELIAEFPTEFEERQFTISRKQDSISSMLDSLEALIGEKQNFILEREDKIKQLGITHGHNFQDQIPRLETYFNRESKQNQLQKELSDLNKEFIFKRDSSNISESSLEMDELKEQIQKKEKELSDLNEMFRLDSLNKYSNTIILNISKKIYLENVQREKYAKSEVSLRNEFFKQKKKLEDQVIELQEKHSSLIQWHLEQKIESNFALDEVRIEFNDGFIENLRVEGKIISEEIENSCNTILGSSSNNMAEDLDVMDQELHFENINPIGFSRKSDYELLKNEPLYTRGGNPPFYSIRLGEIVDRFKYNLALNRRDYSPENQILTISFDGESNPRVEKTLFKSPTYSLFEARIFSDFIGLDAESPNGLIQTEVAKRIILNTERFGLQSPPVSRAISNFFKPYANYTSRINYSILNYIEPTLSFSKIEEDNRFLPLSSLDSIQGNSLIRDRYAGTLDILNYERLNVGLRLNTFVLDLISLKSTIFLNVGMNYGRTPVRDYIYTLDQNNILQRGNEKDSVLNTFRTYWELETQIKPDERYGFNIGYRQTRMLLRSNFVRAVANPELYKLNRKTGFFTNIHSFNFLGHFFPNRLGSDNLANNKFFFRFSFHHMRGQRNTNFLQVQLGSSFFIQNRYKK